MAEASVALYRGGSGEPLVLLHGFTGTWRHWSAVLEPLTRRFEVIAPTLAGHDGGPPYPAGVDVTMAQGADSLERHLDELGVTTAHFVGNSMGGALALEMAKRGRARSVVGLAPAGGWTPGDGEARRLRRFFARQLRTTKALAPRLPAMVSRPRARRMAFRDVMRRGDLLTPSEALDLSLSSIRCEVAERALEALRVDRGLTLDELDRISCPVLVASPQFDRILPPLRHAPRLLREIPGAQARTLAGCGHVPMWDDTDTVVSVICEFVQRSANEHAAPGEPTLVHAPATA
ncbi:MAG TPA: alpha/beta fold hydrolase [Solirubrobacteraceae bacterium]|jgi:pimeloyl-ACP methyl ester carboxylesterase|nr:alpha/beta fold hydrolase [Solirubrobacteraceae bacterium]